jgi:hypothetical protein
VGQVRDLRGQIREMNVNIELFEFVEALRSFVEPRGRRVFSFDD